MTDLLEILTGQKNIIISALVSGSRRDKKLLFKRAAAADILQIVLPPAESPGARDCPDFSPQAVVEACAQFRRKSAKKIILRAEVQHALSRGLRAFFSEFTRAGVDAFVFTDLPPEESGDFLYLAEQNQTRLIFAAAVSAAESSLKDLLQITPQIIFVLAPASGQENIDLEKLQDLAKRLKQKRLSAALCEHALQAEASLRQAYRYFDGLVLNSSEACRLAKNLRKQYLKQNQEQKR